MIFDSLQQTVPGSSGGDAGGSTGGGLITEDTVVTVGASGDYPTITAALEYLSQFSPVFKAAGLNAEVRLLAGFVMAEQVVVKGLDLGWVTIIGDDAETLIDISGFVAIENNLRPAFFGLNNGVLPCIAQLFDMQQTGETAGLDGISLSHGSFVKVMSDCGVKNAGYCGLRVDQCSSASAELAVFSGSKAYGILSDNGSVVHADRAICENCRYGGFYADSGSRIIASYGSAKNGGSYGFRAYRGSFIVAEYSDARYCATLGYYIDAGSFIVLTNYYSAASLGGAVNEYTSNGAYLI